MDINWPEVANRILSNPWVFYPLLASVFLLAIILLFRLRLLTYEDGKFALHLGKQRDKSSAGFAKIDGDDSSIEVKAGGQLTKGVIKGDGSRINIDGSGS